MTDKIYLGILILMLIIVGIGNVHIIKYMGKSKDVIVKSVKKVVKVGKKCKE